MTRSLTMPQRAATLALIARKILDGASPVVERIGGADVRELRRRVLGHCLGDKLRADRFVQYERWRAPKINEREALRRAIRSLEQSSLGGQTTASI